MLTDRSLQESQSQNLNTLATKDAEDKLALAQNTLKLLEDKLKDNEVIDHYCFLVSKWQSSQHLSIL